MDPRKKTGPKGGVLKGGVGPRASLGGFSSNSGVLEGRDPQMCTFGLSGCAGTKNMVYSPENKTQGKDVLGNGSAATVANAAAPLLPLLQRDPKGAPLGRMDANHCGSVSP